MYAFHGSQSCNFTAILNLCLQYETIQRYLSSDLSRKCLLLLDMGVPRVRGACVWLICHLKCHLIG